MQNCHHLRRRVIQYAAASRFCHWRLWNTGSPGQAGRWHRMCVRDLAARCARGLGWSLALQTEGAGKAGCALHPRSRVQVAQKDAHTSIQVQRRHPGFPCAMVLRLISRSPRWTALLPPSPAGYSRQLDASIAAPGPHDFAVRVSLRSSVAAFASTASHPRVRDVRNAPLVGW